MSHHTKSAVEGRKKMIPLPKEYRFAVAAASFKYAGRNDLAAVLSGRPAAAAGVFTRNRFQAAPVLAGREMILAGKPVRGVCINAGQANACTGEEGVMRCRMAQEIAANALGVAPDELLPASTGVIGPQLDMDAWRAAAPALAASLKAEGGKAGPVEFAKAICTTDRFPKLAWGQVEDPDGKAYRVLGVAKGAGMICPDMATMLAVVLTDAAVSVRALQKALASAVDNSFNRITVDGDTSTNDTVYALANGASGVACETDGELEALALALEDVCGSLAYMIVQDAEGGTKVARIVVAGAVDARQADMAARTVGNSPLVKTALFGRDPNWGRIVAALGRSGADFDPDRVSVRIAGAPLFVNGQPVAGDVAGLLAPHLDRTDVSVEIDLGAGPGQAVLLASDLTHDYVSLNAEYTT